MLLLFGDWFMRRGLTLQASPQGTHICRPGCPQTQQSFYLSLPCAGITDT